MDHKYKNSVTHPITFLFTTASRLVMIYRNKRNNHRLSESSLTIVIKVGTTSICDEKTHFPVLSNLSSIVETVLKLKSLGHRVVLVTSAAVGTGLRRLNMEERPKTMAALQVCVLQ